MAYFTDTTNAPKVYLSYEPDRPEGLTYFRYPTDTSPVVRTRQVTTTRYEWRGLTRAAADSIALAKADTNTTARSERMNDANAYKVSIAVRTETTYT